MPDPIYSDFVLPSRGRYYDGKVPGGVVGLRKLTVREESILYGNAVAPHLRIGNVIKACTKLPNDYDMSALLETDRFALLFALRALSFGATYNFSWRCPECDAKNKTDVDTIAELSEKLGTEAEEPLELKLEDAQVTVGLRFLRGADMDSIAAKIKRATAQGRDEAVLITLAHSIATVDGAKPAPGDLDAFLRNLTMRDSQRIRKTIADAETGIDTTCHLTCPSCGEDCALALPLDSEFFRPTSV